jgi:hypothetical protein
MVSEHELKEKGLKNRCYHFTLTELMETLLEAGFGGIRWWQVEGDLLLVASKQNVEKQWTREKSLKY